MSDPTLPQVFPYDNPERIEHLAVTVLGELRTLYQALVEEMTRAVAQGAPERVEAISWFAGPVAVMISEIEERWHLA